MNAVTGREGGRFATSFGVGIDHTIGALTFGIGYGILGRQENAAVE